MNFHHSGLVWAPLRVTMWLSVGWIVCWAFITHEFRRHVRVWVSGQAGKRKMGAIGEQRVEGAKGGIPRCSRTRYRFARRARATVARQTSIRHVLERPCQQRPVTDAALTAPSALRRRRSAGSYRHSTHRKRCVAWCRLRRRILPPPGCSGGRRSASCRACIDVAPSAGRTVAGLGTR